jgi:nitrite reductase/ring-hydroxylating ferredoxin subunit
MYSKIRKILFLLFVLFVNTFCSTEEHPVPNVSVSVTIGPTTLAQLGVNSSMYYSGTAGIKGIIIYKESEGNYLAFERLCPYYPNDDCAVDIDDSKISAKCPCCGSEFSLIFGTVLNGPAKFSLKQYQTYFTGTRLEITN